MQRTSHSFDHLKIPYHTFDERNKNANIKQGRVFLDIIITKTITAKNSKLYASLLLFATCTTMEIVRVHNCLYEVHMLCAASSFAQNIHLNQFSIREILNLSDAYSSCKDAIKVKQKRRMQHVRTTIYPHVCMHLSAK